MKRKKWSVLLCAWMLCMAVALAGCGAKESAEESMEEREEESAKKNGEESADENAEEGVKENTEGGAGEKRALGAEELQQFTDFVNERANNGFLLSEYDEPSKVNVDFVLYSGADIETEPLSEAEAKAYEAKAGSIELDIVRLTTAQIDEFLQRKMGITLKDVSGGLDWVYLDEFDCYVCQHGDCLWYSFTCTEGEQVGNDLYRLRCEKDDTDESCLLTLRKTAEGYQFVSNQIDGA